MSKHDKTQYEFFAGIVVGATMLAAVTVYDLVRLKHKIEDKDNEKPKEVTE